MAIVVNLDELLYARRMTLTELADRVGITLANLSILKTGKAKAIRFSTLDAICRQLGCQPGDLLSFNANGASAPAEKAATERSSRVAHEPKAISRVAASSRRGDQTERSMFWVPGFTRQKSGGKVSAKLTSPSNGIAANAAMSVMRAAKLLRRLVTAR